MKAEDVNNGTIPPEGSEFHRWYRSLTAHAQEKVIGSINIAYFNSDIKERLGSRSWCPCLLCFLLAKFASKCILLTQFSLGIICILSSLHEK